MGTDPFTKSWWFLEAHDGSWLADRDHELFTREPHKALKWPNFTDADRARRALHQPLWNRIRAPTEHVFLDLETPTPPPVPAVTREALVEMLTEAFREGCQAVHDNYQPDPDPDFSEAASDYAASILSRLATGQQGETEK